MHIGTYRFCVKTAPGVSIYFWILFPYIIDCTFKSRYSLIRTLSALLKHYYYNLYPTRVVINLILCKQDLAITYVYSPRKGVGTNSPQALKLQEASQHPMLQALEVS